MASDKKVRKDTAIKKARLKKKIIIAVCIGIAAVTTLFVIINLFSAGRLQSNNERVNIDRNMDVDIDLTILGENMMRAEVVRILSSPDEYLGKVIKIHGSYYAIPEPTIARVQNIIAVSEVDACCPPLGFEVIVGDFDNPHPFDFPNQGTRIEVTGVFSTYEKRGLIFTIWRLMMLLYWNNRRFIYVRYFSCN